MLLEEKNEVFNYQLRTQMTSISAPCKLIILDNLNDRASNKDST